MNQSAPVIAAMLAVSFMLPAQAPDPMGIPDAFNLTDTGQEGWTPGLAQDSHRQQAPSRHHSRRKHHRHPAPRRHVDG
jgi:hypothetical protein